jgi:nitrous oxidase accessory protein
VPIVGERRAALILLLLLVLLLVFIPEIGMVKAESKTIVVPDDFPSVQEAIDYADEGDIVFVKSGIYYQTAIINKSLSLVGENRETTIIDGNGTTTRVYVERDNVTITGFTIRNALVTTEAGIFLMRVDYCNISENKLTDNSRGIDLLDSSYNIIAGNFMEENGAGISLSGFNNSIYGNEIVNCNTGIQISYGKNNTISENNIVNSHKRGINLPDSQNNSFFLNNIVNSGEYGILFTNSHNNTFIHNNFINNVVQVFDSHYVLDWIALSVNIWDNGFEGNYWDNYNGTDGDGNGIGDTSYIINENNQDNYPLVNVIPEFPSWIILPLFLTATLVVIFYSKRLRARLRHF